MDTLTKREINMLKTFKPGRFWHGMPQTAEGLLNRGYIKRSDFGPGNFCITDKGRQYLKALGETK